jgi:hypothetical protein
MRSGLVAFIAFLALAFGTACAAENTSPTPLLIELFTSEGCSSCPPADAQLRQLDKLQPVSGVELIVLSEHVDYWNNLGWKDPYSSSSFSDRQGTYASHFRLESSYTPQMVVDGSAECVGGNAALLNGAIAKARLAPKISVRITNAAVDPSGVLQAHVEIEALPESFKPGKAGVYLALALEHADSQVGRGENQGRHLEHVAVVLNLKGVGKIEAGKPFSQDVQIKADSRGDLSHLRLIAFVQEAGPGRVLGAAMQRVGK